MKLSAARPARRLAVAADLIHDRHHLVERLLGARIGEPVLQVGPPGAHDEIAIAGQARPQLLRHEGHEGMQHAEEVVQAEVRNVLGRGIARAQAVLHRLEIPIAKLVPRERVRGVDRILEGEVVDAGRDVGPCVGEPREYPSVLQVLAGLEESRRIDRRRARRAQNQSRRVPQLVAEPAVAFDAALVETHVLARHRDRGRPRAKRVGAVLVDQAARVDTCAERLRHPPPIRRLHDAVNRDVGERHILHELDAGHDHPADPEVDDLPRGAVDVGGIEGLQVVRLVRPAERRERPKR